MRIACIKSIYELAKLDERVIFIGSDLGAGILDPMKQEMPERFFMEGICEQNIIGMAAGLALEGYIPYVNTIATFITRRCYEQVAIDLCLHNLPVRLIGNGGGLVYAPLGPTHMAIEDIAIMRALPNMAVVVPADADEMKRFMLKTIDWPGPVYIRLAKGGDQIVSRESDDFTIGKSIMLRETGEILIIATGIMVQHALAAAEQLVNDEIFCKVMNMHTIKPLDVDALISHARGSHLIVTVEEHSHIGGLGSAVVDSLIENTNSPLPMIKRLALPDQFTSQYGSQNSLLDHYGLNMENIINTVKGELTAIAA